MKKTSNISGKELSPLDEKDLDTLSGGKVVRTTYYVNKGGYNEVKRDVYYCPRNGKYYASSINATTADQELGGDGTIKDGSWLNNYQMPSVDDIPDYASWFNSKIK